MTRKNRFETAVKSPIALAAESMGREVTPVPRFFVLCRRDELSGRRPRCKRVAGRMDHPSRVCDQTVCANRMSAKHAKEKTNLSRFICATFQVPDANYR